MAQKAPPVQELMSEKGKEPVEDDNLYICDMIELEKLLKEKGLDHVDYEGPPGDCGVFCLQVIYLLIKEGQDAEELRALENVRRRVIDITRDEIKSMFDAQVDLLTGKEEMSMAAAAAAARKTCNQLYGGNNGEGDAFAMMKYLIGSGRYLRLSEIMAFAKHFHKEMHEKQISMYSCQGGIPQWNIIHLGGVEETEAKACFYIIHLKAEHSANDHFLLAKKINEDYLRAMKKVPFGVCIPPGTIVCADFATDYPAKKIKRERDQLGQFILNGGDDDVVSPTKSVISVSSTD